jgi:hypothetical protein
VFTLRCTARLSKRLGPAMAAAPPAPTTRLGDWYANLVHVGRMQLVLAVSDRTFLPLVLPAAPSAALVPRLCAGIEEMLRALGIAELDVEKERAAMHDVVYAKTANRQVTGVLVSTGSPDATTVALFGAKPLSRDRWEQLF